MFCKPANKYPGTEFVHQEYELTVINDSVAKATCLKIMREKTTK